MESSIPQGAVYFCETLKRIVFRQIWPLQIEVSTPFGGASADYDADGDLDVYISVFRGPDVLPNNDGYGGFTDVSRALGLPENESRSTTVTW